MGGQEIIRGLLWLLGRMKTKQIKRTPLAHWAYRYIGNGSEPTSCAVLIKTVGVPEMKDHESPNTSFGLHF